MEAEGILAVDGSRMSSNQLRIGSRLLGALGLFGAVYLLGWKFIADALQNPFPWKDLITYMIPVAYALLASGAMKFAIRRASNADQVYAWSLALDDRQVANFISAKYPNGGLIEARDMTLIARYAAEVGHKAVSKAGAAKTAMPWSDIPEFDYSAGEQNDLFFRRYQGDEAFISVGRPDWMPVAAFLLLAGGERGETVLLDALAAKAGVEQLRGTSQWCRASIKTMMPLMTQIDALDAPRLNTERIEGEPQDGYDGLTSIEAYDAFFVAWGSCQGVAGGDWLASSDRRIAYLGLPELEAHRRAVDDLHIATMKWATAWLASSGLQVAQHQQLVHVPGYVPLVDHFIDLA